MRSPATALLWESWRLTRDEVALRMFGGGLLVSVGVLGVFAAFGNLENGIMAVLLQQMFRGVFGVQWVRLSDWRGKTGFPFDSGYPRPVPTWVLVGVPMAYLGASCAAVYLVPLLIIGTTLGVPFPLTPVASVAATALVFAAANWWTRDKALRRAGYLAAVASVLLLLRRLAGPALRSPERWPDVFAFTVADYGVIALMAAAAVGLTILGVDRQRRGDTWAFRPDTGGATSLVGAPGRLIALRLPCPASSPTRAQVWFEMRRMGWRLLAAGALTAVGIPLLLSLANVVQWLRAPAVLYATCSPLMPLVVGLQSIFGLRLSPGRTSMGPFEATVALTTARLVGVKVFVPAVCLLGAWATIGAGLWTSVPLTGHWERIPFWGDPVLLLAGRAHIAAAVKALPAGSLGALLVVVSIQLLSAAALFMSLQVLWVWHSLRVFYGALALALYALVVSNAPAGPWSNPPLADAHLWIVAVLIPAGTVSVFRKALAEGILTRRFTATAVFLWVGFAALWVAVSGSGALFSGTSAADVALTLSLGLLPLGAAALAPWTIGWLRHS